MIGVCGLLASQYQSEGWWDVISATCLAAWQARGAASQAASYLDLTGNGYTLSGASPTWNASIGWTSNATFDALSITLPYSISIVWLGDVVYLSSDPSSVMCSNSLDSWAGPLLIGHNTYTDIWYAGYNSSDSYNERYIVTSTDDAVFVYTKNGSTQDQHGYQNGLELTPDSDRAGSTPTVRDFKLWTGIQCGAAAIYDGVLSAADVLSISNALNSL